MIDLRLKSLPNVIQIEGKDFSIYTDFRVWLRFAIDVSHCKGNEIEVGYLFKNEMPSRCNIQPLLDFAFPKTEIPRQVGKSSDAIILDYEIDADLIYAAFLGQYGIDLLTTDMHWFVFQALLKGLTEQTKLREVMGYRAYEKEDGRNIDYNEQLRMAWEIIPEDTSDIDPSLAKYS